MKPVEPHSKSMQGLAASEAVMPAPVIENGRELWYVDKILDRMKKNMRMQYYVTYVGYPESEGSWELIGDLGGCRAKIREFEMSKYVP